MYTIYIHNAHVKIKKQPILFWNKYGIFLVQFQIHISILIGFLPSIEYWYPIQKLVFTMTIRKTMGSCVCTVITLRWCYLVFAITVSCINITCIKKPKFCANFITVTICVGIEYILLHYYFLCKLFVITRCVATVNPTGEACFLWAILLSTPKPSIAFFIHITISFPILALVVSCAIIGMSKL